MTSFNDDIEKYKTINNIRYNDTKDAINIVEKFIKSKNLILVGGQALDYAFRLKNSHIYDDWEMPDYDFYSTQHHIDAYELGEILCKKGFSDVSVINARHITTMRIRVQFVYVADITFCPKIIFDKINTLEYNGFRIIDPNMQRLDQLLSLARPYQNPPTEVIYHRAAKDLKRLLELETLYPINDIISKINPNVIQNMTFSTKSDTKNITNKKYIYHGITAFNLYRDAFINEFKGKPPFKLPVIEEDVTIMLDKENADKLIAELNPTKIIKYKPFLDKRNVYFKLNNMEIHLDNENVTVVDYRGYQMTNIFYVLFYFAFKLIVEKDEISGVLLDYLLRMAELSKLPLFLMSTKINEYRYGALELLNKERMNYAINNKPAPKKQPSTYYPEKETGCKTVSAQNKLFDISDNVYFDIDGTSVEFSYKKGGYMDETELEHTLEDILSASDIIGCIHSRDYVGGDEISVSELLVSSGVSCIDIDQ